MTNTSTQENQPARENRDLARYEILMTRRFTIEKVFWSRIQTLHAIQAAVLASGFLLLMHDDPYPTLSGCVFSLGALLTCLLYFLARNDWNDAKANDAEYSDLEKRVCIKRTAGRCCKLLRSHSIMFFIMKLFLALDAVFAIAAFSDGLLAGLLSRS